MFSELTRYRPNAAKSNSEQVEWKMMLSTPLTFCLVIEKSMIMIITIPMIRILLKLIIRFFTFYEARSPVIKQEKSVLVSYIFIAVYHPGTKWF